MTVAIEVTELTKRYRGTAALDRVSVGFEQNTITGLLGRNGAGKTTLMSIITAQNFATSGDVRVYGEHPYENARVLSRLCFVRESQKYPDDATPRHAFRIAELFYENWDVGLSERLAEEFRLPLDRRIKKLSRGQLSAVGVILGIASRAEITFFDEPYLGLDAVARQIFYDRLLEDYAQHPRAIILSSHLIDEVSNLLERVVVLDGGRVIMDESTDELRDRAATVVGATASVDSALADLGQGHEVVHRESLGPVSSVTVLGPLGADERERILDAGLELGPVSLQQLIVRTTQAAESQDDTAPSAKGALR